MHGAGRSRGLARSLCLHVLPLPCTHRQTQQAQHARDQLIVAFIAGVHGIAVNDLAKKDRGHQRQHLADGRKQQRQPSQLAVRAQLGPENVHGGVSFRDAAQRKAEARAVRLGRCHWHGGGGASVTRLAMGEI